MKDILPLKAIATDEGRNAAFLTDLERRIETRVRGIGALEGIVIRNTYSAIKAIRPGYVRHLLKVLSRDYIDAYTPLHEEYRNSQVIPSESIAPLSSFVDAHKDEVKAIFWRIADKYGDHYKQHFIGKIYAKFKPMIDEHLPIVLSELTEAIEDCTVVDVKS